MGHQIINSSALRVVERGKRAILHGAAICCVAFLASIFLPTNAKAGVFDCNCKLECNSSDGKNFDIEWDTGKNFSTGLAKCRKECEKQEAAKLSSAAAQNNACGTIDCDGYSYIGNSPDFNQQRDLSARTTRTCTPDNPVGPHAACCPPGDGTDISSVFNQVQTTDVSDPYEITYAPGQNGGYDAMLQQYLNYVGAAEPAITTMDVTYNLTGSASATATVTYTEQTSSPTWTPFFQPNGALQVNEVYRVTRTLTFRDAQGTAISYYDPECRNRAFEFDIHFKAFQVSYSGEPSGLAFATIRVEGRPNRVVAFNMEQGATGSTKALNFGAELEQQLNSNGRGSRAPGVLKKPDDEASEVDRTQSEQ